MRHLPEPSVVSPSSSIVRPAAIFRHSRIVARTGCCPCQKGSLQGDYLVCKYHGLEFNECGECVWMPGQQGIHKDTDLRRYPVAEKYRFIWVWLGDPSLTDERKILDLHWCADSRLVFDGSTYRIRCA
jgi:phenylpropionate dioxygenase-like ring-hydroxylating dioxygenase large terminal subunit